MKTLNVWSNQVDRCPWGCLGGSTKKFSEEFFSKAQDISFRDKTFIVWLILSDFKLKLTKMAKNRQNGPLGSSGGPTQKKFFKKIEKKSWRFWAVFNSPNFRGISQGGNPLQIQLSMVINFYLNIGAPFEHR